MRAIFSSSSKWAECNGDNFQYRHIAFDRIATKERMVQLWFKKKNTWRVSTWDEMHRKLQRQQLVLVKKAQTSTTVTNRISRNQRSKNWITQLFSFSAIIKPSPILYQFFLRLDRFLLGRLSQTAGWRECFPRVHWYRRQESSFSIDVRAYFASPKDCWVVSIFFLKFLFDDRRKRSSLFQ